MYAYVILSLILAMVSLDVAGDWPRPPLAWALAWLVVVAAVVSLAGLAISVYIIWNRAGLDQDEQRFLGKIGVLGKTYRLFIVGAYAFVLFVAGWAPLGAEIADGVESDALTVAVVLVPLVVLLVVGWMALYWADRALRMALFERAGAAAAAVARQWSLLRYLEFMLRQYLLVLVVPLLVLLAVSDGLIRLFGSSAESSVSAVVLFAAVLAAVVLAGPWLRFCWRTEPLPEGELRDRLYALANRAHVHVGEVLVWRTNLSIANGAMIGILAPVRYIMITDALLLAMSPIPEEVESVFAHEVAHVKYHHTPLYVAMAVGGMSLAMLAGEVAAAATSSSWIVNAAVVAFVVIYWWLGFGFVSRRCELEADLYACRATTCPAGCSPPDPGRSAAPGMAGENQAPGMAGGNSLCPHRVQAFVSALQRISRLNGLPENRRGWRHFSVARRSAFLAWVLGDPSRVTQVERSFRRLKMAAVAIAFAATLAAALMAYALGLSAAHHPHHRTRPQNIGSEDEIWVMGFVDRDEVNAVAFGSPQLDRQSDAAADLDDGRLTRTGLRAAAADDDVAVEDSRGHAVAVHAQGKRARLHRPGPGQVQELDDPVRRRLG